ncbi:MAG: restriction endonuclease subunit S [Anaerolineaceae bacterium]
MNWIKHKLGDCAYLVRSSVQPDEVKDEKYIGLEHISQGDLALLGYGYANDVVSQKNQFIRGDILFGKLRPYFRKVILAPFDGVCSTDIWVVRAKPGIDQRFLYYWMASKEFVEKVSQASEGTKMPRASWGFAAQVESNIPPLSEQSAIAEVLSALDDKIELNRRMNQTLEELAQAIFKHWFVDNPERDGWEDGMIGSIAFIEKNTINPYHFPDGIYAHFSIPAFDDNRIPKIETGKLILSNKFVMPESCILISKLNPLIKRIWFPSIQKYQSICSTEFLVVVPKQDYSKEYLFALLSEEGCYKRFTSLVTGTTGSHQRVKPDDFLDIEVRIPPISLINSFTKVTADIFNLINANITESNTLTELRDILLPKLMSGQVKVV